MDEEIRQNHFLEQLNVNTERDVIVLDYLLGFVVSTLRELFE